MDRRRFLKASAAVWALSRVPGHAAEILEKKRRVGLIGSGTL